MDKNIFPRQKVLHVVISLLFLALKFVSALEGAVPFQPHVTKQLRQPCKSVPSEIDCSLDKVCEYEDEVDLRVIVMTYNRPESLKQTLNHVQNLVTDGDKVKVEIWIDCSVDGTYDVITYETAKLMAVKSPIPTRVHVWPSHVGIYGQWINTWGPKINTTEHALMVEDDIDISPYVWVWLKAVREYYKTVWNLGSYSLRDQWMGSKAEQIVGLDPVFFQRCGLPWGIIPKPDVWRDFQEWYMSIKNDTSFHPYVPEDKKHTKYYRFSERKDNKSMWSMWFHYYNYMHELLSIFPNVRAIGDGKGLEYNRREPGLHFSGNRKAHRSNINSEKIITQWHSKYTDFPVRTKIIDYDSSLYGTVVVN